MSRGRALNRDFIESFGLRGAVESSLGVDLRLKISALSQSGATVVFLCHDGALRGVFAVSDKVREEAAEAVAMLKKMGLGLSLATGDQANTAEAVAKQTGIGPVQAQASTAGKAAEVRRLEEAGRRVLMAGDGRDQQRKREIKQEVSR